MADDPTLIDVSTGTTAEPVAIGVIVPDPDDNAPLTLDQILDTADTANGIPISLLGAPDEPNAALTPGHASPSHDEADFITAIAAVGGWSADHFNPDTKRVWLRARPHRDTCQYGTEPAPDPEEAECQCRDVDYGAIWFGEWSDTRPADTTGWHPVTVASW